MTQELKPQKGTTTVGLICKDGIVLAADRRASAGYLVANRKEEKVKIISDHMAITTAGLVSDAQLFTRIIKAQLALLSIRKGKEPTLKESANLLASLTYSNIRKPSMVPGIVGFLLGGWDKYGAHLYSIGFDGAVTKFDDFTSDGSGSYVALGVLESIYKPGMSVEEGVKVVAKAINVAIHRDLATGDGIDVLVIDQTGVRKVMAQELRQNIKIE